MSITIEYLADHHAFAPMLAEWHHAEWSPLLPDWSRAEAEAELHSHAGRCQVPTTFVALEAGVLVGSASLLAKDLDELADLTPWLASVFVIPEARSRGIGKMLVFRVVEEARALGYRAIHLWTAGQADYYRRLGWAEWRRVMHHGNEFVVMRLNLR